jgi:hypothetical protein
MQILSFFNGILVNKLEPGELGTQRRFISAFEVF